MVIHLHIRLRIRISRFSFASVWQVLLRTVRNLDLSARLRIYRAIEVRWYVIHTAPCR
jgi:hypothetical protein